MVPHPTSTRRRIAMITDDLAQALRELLMVVEPEVKALGVYEEHHIMYHEYTDAVEVLRRYDEGERE
jgi:hypothetical protein